MDHDTQKTAFLDPFIKESKFGTVGAVALDKNGNIAAGTSTGGMTNKNGTGLETCLLLAQEPMQQCDLCSFCHRLGRIFHPRCNRL